MPQCFSMSRRVVVNSFLSLSALRRRVNSSNEGSASPEAGLPPGTRPSPASQGCGARTGGVRRPAGVAQRLSHRGSACRSSAKTRQRPTLRRFQERATAVNRREVNVLPGFAPTRSRRSSGLRASAGVRVEEAGYVSTFLGDTSGGPGSTRRRAAAIPGGIAAVSCVRWLLSRRCRCRYRCSCGRKRYFRPV